MPRPISYGVFCLKKKSSRAWACEGSRSFSIRLKASAISRAGDASLTSKVPPIAHMCFNATTTREIYTLSLHDALPISTVDIFTFYVPHRHVYGEQWIKFMKDGVNALFTINVTMRDKIGRAVQQECRDRSRMPSSA